MAKAKKKTARKVARRKSSSDVPWPRAALQRQFGEFSLECQIVAVTFAAWGQEITKREVFQLLLENDALNSEGKLFKQTHSVEAIRELTQLEWLEPAHGGKYFLAPQLINEVLEFGQRADLLRTLSGSILNERSALIRQYRNSYRQPGQFVINRARIAFFLGDWKLLAEIDTKDNRDYGDEPLYNLFSFLSTSPYLELLHRLPTKYLNLAVVQMGHGICRNQSSVGDFLPAAKITAVAYPTAGIFYPEILYLRGDLELLNEYLLEIAGGSTSEVAPIEMHQISGSIAFLNGDDEAAIAEFDLAIAAIKSGTRKRKVCVRGFCGVFYIIALIRAGTPEHLEKAKLVAKAGAESEANPWRNMFEDLERAVLFILGAKNKLSDDYAWVEAPPAELLTVGWFELWNEGTDLPDMRRFDRLMVDAEQAEENGYVWLAGELYELASRFGDASYSKELADKAKSLRASIHPDLRSPFDALKKREPWEEALLGIEVIAQKAKPAKKKSVDGKPLAAGRLLWVIDFNPKYPETWQLIPMEQKLGKTGKWNKPRTINPKRLTESPPDFATDQDRSAANHVGRERSWGGGSITFLKQERAIIQLVGHPLLFLDGELTRPVELAKREAELVLQPAGKGEIYLRIDPPITPGCKVTLTQDTPARLFITEATAAVRGLLDLFGADGITLPEAAKERVLKAASSLAGEINVQSQIGGEGLAQAQTVKPNATPQLHLVPHGNGLSAEILLQPIPDVGNHYQPGHGVELVFARAEDDTNIQTKRSLETEATNARTAIDACPTLAEAERVSAYHWTLPDPISCLELLTDLQHLDSSALTIHWPKGETFKLKALAETKNLRMTLKKDREWFKASGELKVDDKMVLSMQELLDLLDVEGTGRFIQLADGQFLALTEEFRRRLDELKAFSTPAKGGELQINELAAYALEELAANAQLKADKAWRDHIAKLDTAEEFEAEVPKALRAELRPYQLDGFRWLAKLAEWGVGACLADDMGLGKTVQALALLLHRAKGGPALVIAPTSVATNWMRETARFAPTLNVRQFGPGDRAESLADLSGFDLIICTFGLMQIENKLLSAVDWHTVIIDEAQAIKNAATKRSKAALKLKAGFRVITTGTPIENNLSELHSLFQFINPGLLGSAQKFHRRFGDPIQKTDNPQVRRWLKKLIAPFILRRLKHEVLEDLPPRTEIVLSVEMSKEETAFYEALRERAVRNLESERSQTASGQQGIRILAEITRLRRACCNPQLVTKDEPAPSSSKLAMFGETIADLLEADHKVLVFSQFVDHLSILRKHLDGENVTYQYLDGSTTPKKRQQAIDAFQSGEGEVFLISLKAGGTGLNLTAADYVIHMDPWWNPASEDQASDRAHRIGQLRPVTVYRLVMKGTIEEKIVALHHEKRDLASSLMEGTDTGRKLNPEELLNLIRG